MIKIVNASNGTVIGSTDSPIFIKLNPNNSGAFIQTNQESAQGIAFLGNPYNLIGKIPLNPDLSTVILVEIDSGSELDKTSAALAETSATLDSIIISLLDS